MSKASLPYTTKQERSAVLRAALRRYRRDERHYKRLRTWGAQLCFASRMNERLIYTIWFVSALEKVAQRMEASDV